MEGTGVRVLARRVGMGALAVHAGKKAAVMTNKVAFERRRRYFKYGGSFLQCSTSIYMKQQSLEAAPARLVDIFVT